MDTESAFWLLHEIEEEHCYSLYSEWQSAKGNPHARQSWGLIPSGLLIKEWQYNQRTGLVHEKVIERIQKICIDNYCKLYINTILFGHTELSPYDYFEVYIPQEWTEEDFEEWLEDFEWFACDQWGDWRMSDQIERMDSLVIGLMQEEDHCKKLYWIDRILNFAHQRSDLASWFVEDGSRTLGALAND